MNEPVVTTLTIIDAIRVVKNGDDILIHVEFTRDNEKRHRTFKSPSGALAFVRRCLHGAYLIQS